VSPNRDPLDEDPTPPPFAVDDPELSMRLTVNAIWKGLRRLNHRLDEVLPTLVTRAECGRNHPGVERVLKFVLLIVGVLAAGWGGWKFIAATERNEKLAQEFRLAWPMAHAARPMLPIPYPIPVAEPDAASTPAKRRRP
jgi:hypothetical protein